MTPPVIKAHCSPCGFVASGRSVQSAWAAYLDHCAAVHTQPQPFNGLSGEALRKLVALVQARS